jgi:hypothetical protein
VFPPLGVFLFSAFLFALAVIAIGEVGRFEFASCVFARARFVRACMCVLLFLLAFELIASQRGALCFRLLT